MARDTDKLWHESNMLCYHCYVILAILHLGLLEDISLAQIYCADLNSVVFFLLSCCYLFSKWNIFFSLSRLYSFFFCLSPLLSFYLSPLLLSTFYLSSSHILSLFLHLPLSLSIFYFLAAFYLFSLTFLIYPLPSLFASVSFFVFFYFLAVFYLFSLTFLVYPLPSLFASVSFFVFFYFPSWVSSNFFLCLSLLLYSPSLLFSLLWV